MSIVVQIECKGEYNVDIYTDPWNCYLAQALKKAGYTDVAVGAIGRVRIGKDNYNTKEPFNSTVLKKAFEKQETLTVELN
jgi:hypothetical protein